MEKKKIRQEESLGAFIFDPAAIIMMAYGQSEDGVPVIADFRDLTDKWLGMIHDYSILVEESEDRELSNEYLWYAKMEAERFARVVIEGKTRSDCIALPSEWELCLLMEAVKNDVSKFTFMVYDFSLHLYRAIKRRAEQNHVHIIIVPSISNVIRSLASEKGKTEEMVSMLSVLMLHEKARDFLKEHGKLPGKLTVLPLDIWENGEGKERKIDFSKNNGVFTVHRSAELLAVTESDEERFIHGFPDFMYQEDGELTDMEKEYLDDVVDDIFGDYYDEDIIVLEPETLLEGNRGRMDRDHLEAISEYFLNALIQQSTIEGKHVVLASFRDLDKYFKYIAPIYNEQKIPCPRCGKDVLKMDRYDGITCPRCKARFASPEEITASGLTSVVKDFVRQFPILPGSITEI